MATADRLYQAACECRDLETRLDRLILDSSIMDAKLTEIKEAAQQLLRAIDMAENILDPADYLRSLI